MVAIGNSIGKEMNMAKTAYFLIYAGLGNQLFQYAAGLYAETLWGVPVRFHVQGHPRPFMLNQFMITSPMYPVGPWTSKMLYGSKPTAFKKGIRRICGVHLIDEIEQYKVDSQLLTLPVERKVLARGFWQSKDYLNGLVTRLRSEFRFRNQPDDINAVRLADIKSKACPVSLHIRRGDYLNHATNGEIVLPLEYYQTAIKTIQIRFRDAHFFVFSDELEWAKSHLPAGLPISFVEGNGEERAYEDLRLMSACKHHIIANSTFSWWGAWLNPDPAKIVLMPQSWFGTMPTPAGLIVDGWRTCSARVASPCGCA